MGMGCTHAIVRGEEEHWAGLRDSMASPGCLRWIQGSPPEDHSVGEC